MKIRIGSGLVPQNLLVLLLIVIIIFAPSNVLRIILGLPLILFFPGYTLVLALFPMKEQIGNMERIALSFGMSIATVLLIGLILNYTPWGITIESTLYSAASFIFLLSFIAWLRLSRLVEHERFNLESQMKLPSWRGSIWDKALSVVLIVAIFGAIGTFGYVLATQKVGERFTEFYILNIEGEATDYPKELSVGEEGKVIVGIINHEQEAATYRIEVAINGVKDNESGPIFLENDAKWEMVMGFTPNIVGDNQKVEFLLYKEGQTEVYQSLHLWIDILG